MAAPQLCRTTRSSSNSLPGILLVQKPHRRAPPYYQVPVVLQTKRQQSFITTCQPVSGEHKCIFFSAINVFKLGLLQVSRLQVSPSARQRALFGLPDQVYRPAGVVPRICCLDDRQEQRFVAFPRSVHLKSRGTHWVLTGQCVVHFLCLKISSFLAKSSSVMRDRGQ